MFGQRTEGHNGVVYDSASEGKVAQALHDLEREQVIRGFISHPIVSGIEYDFLVQLGKMGAKKGAPSQRSGRVMLLEYDGLGEARRDDLSEKLYRNALLGAMGIHVRWLIDPGYDSVRSCLVDYEPPHFVTKRMTCNCGETVKIVVIAHRPESREQVEIEGRYTCAACNETQ